MFCWNIDDRCQPGSGSLEVLCNDVIKWERKAPSWLLPTSFGGPAPDDPPPATPVSKGKEDNFVSKEALLFRITRCKYIIYGHAFLLQIYMFSALFSSLCIFFFRKKKYEEGEGKHVKSLYGGEGGRKGECFFDWFEEQTIKGNGKFSSINENFHCNR